MVEWEPQRSQDRKDFAFEIERHVKKPPWSIECEFQKDRYLN